jgi:hypothetical protein
LRASQAFRVLGHAVPAAELALEGGPVVPEPLQDDGLEALVLRRAVMQRRKA